MPLRKSTGSAASRMRTPGGTAITPAPAPPRAPGAAPPRPRPPRPAPPPGRARSRSGPPAPAMSPPHPPRPPPGPAPGEWRGEIRTSCGRWHDDRLHVGPRLGRGSVAQARVQTPPVVKDLDVLEHRRPGLRAAAEPDVVDVLLLERGEEGLHRRVVEAVAAPAHRLPDAVPPQHLAVRLGGVQLGLN